jgi:magnesium transporter
MSKLRRHRLGKRAPVRPGRYLEPGTAPGTLVFDPAAPHPAMQLIAYSADDLVERTIEDPEEIRAELGRWPVVWINVDGIGNGELLRRIGEIFRVHLLAMEDVVNLGQRAKVEPYDEDLFIVARMPTADLPQTEQVSIFLGSAYVLTIQERPGDVFESVRERIRKGRLRVRSSSPDYLVYALLDAIVDSFFPILDITGEELHRLEDEVLDAPDKSTVHQIHRIRRTLVELRRAVGPHREALNTLLREASYIRAETAVFLRDTYDHAIRIMDLLETQREISSDLMATYLSAVSNRMNEVMKVLTIVATIFIPLGFIAGVYGMNFNSDVSPWNMPELNWFLGYPFALSLMAGVAAAFLWLIWRRGWFT